MTEAGSSSFGGACPSSRSAFAAGGLTLLGLGLALAACGGQAASSAARVPAPVRVCGHAAQAARKRLGPVSLRVADADPANIECLLLGGGSRIDAVAQAATQAWTEYDTILVHQVQAYASGVTYTPSQIPQNVTIAHAQAAWIPAKRELVATNGTESSAGSFVTVTLTGPVARGARGASVARAVGAAVLSVAPRGPSPGPPPS